VLLSIVFDYRRVMGPLDAEGPLDELLRTCKLYPNFLRHLSRRALEEKPPTGFFKDLVVESKGQQAGRLDIKHKASRWSLRSPPRSSAIARSMRRVLR
jgi:CBS domain-containing protein